MACPVDGPTSGLPLSASLSSESSVSIYSISSDTDDSSDTSSSVSGVLTPIEFISSASLHMTSNCLLPIGAACYRPAVTSSNATILELPSPIVPNLRHGSLVLGALTNPFPASTLAPDPLATPSPMLPLWTTSEQVDLSMT